MIVIGDLVVISNGEDTHSDKCITHRQTQTCLYTYAPAGTYVAPAVHRAARRGRGHGAHHHENHRQNLPSQPRVCSARSTVVLGEGCVQVWFRAGTCMWRYWSQQVRQAKNTPFCMPGLRTSMIQHLTELQFDYGDHCAPELALNQPACPFLLT